jgi:hypothetical protein
LTIDDLKTAFVFNRQSSIVNRQLFLPARLGDSRNFPGKRQRSETQAAELEFPVISARASTTQAPVMRAHLIFRRFPGFGLHAISCHNNSVSIFDFRLTIDD